MSEKQHYLTIEVDVRITAKFKLRDIMDIVTKYVDSWLRGNDKPYKISKFQILHLKVRKT